MRKNILGSIFAFILLAIPVLFGYSAGYRGGKRASDKWWQKTDPARCKACILEPGDPITMNFEPVQVPADKFVATGAEVTVPLDYGLAREIAASLSSAKLARLWWQASLRVIINDKNKTEVWYCVTMWKNPKTSVEACRESLAEATDAAFRAKTAGR